MIDRNLRYGQICAVFIISTGFLVGAIWEIYIMTRATREDVTKKISYLYLAAFITLISAHAFLFAQMRDKNKKLGLGNVFRKE